MSGKESFFLGLCLVAAICFIVAVTIVIAIAWTSPSISGKCKYAEVSLANFRINNNLLTNDKMLYFDSYTKEIVDGDEVITVQGYWKLNGLVWEKCEGKLKFVTKVGFNPTLLHKPRESDNSMQILEQDCK